MALFTLADLTTPLTRAEVQEKIYEAIALVGTDTTTWKPGAVVRTMIAACSIVIAAHSSLIALIARSGFLELAEGAWLALVAWYVYGVEKETATFAEGEVTLVNAGGGIYLLDADDLTVSNPVTGKQYRNTSSLSLPALGTITVPVRAVEAGAASTSAPSSITQLVTPLLGVSCTNAAAVVGLDEEADPALRVRCAEKLGALSPFGPWDAYAYAARNARRSDGSRVGVSRVRTKKDGFGNVTTYVASSSGAVTGTIGNLATDLGAVNEAIQRLSAPLAVTAWVASAVPVPIAVTYRISMYNTSGLTQAEIVEAIEARLVAFMVGQPVGGNVIGADLGKVFQDAIETAIGATLPQIFHVEVTSPAADVALGVAQVPVLGTVTATAITQVPPSEGALT
jgi:phage-related baseplate assembly protein